uniref:Uncharacterized protein n=1 Tax=Rhizochromulina marina TaxID=1034831 RepID=A0A7S2WJA3_9STRA|mmetsp:Transcript_25952/g.75644  ORF Transcript_25952/g.75644 Transcript_25952/m.75644 type:complete len:185 (+) Transcript_25952:11-565(+)
MDKHGPSEDKGHHSLPGDKAEGKGWEDQGPGAKGGGSEDKEHAERPAAEAKAGHTPTVDVTRVEIAPNECPVCDPLTLEMDFLLSQGLPEAQWVVKFLVDSAQERHVVDLGATDVEDYRAGPNSFLFEVPTIDISGIRPGALANCGLLTASLVCGADTIIDVNMVVMVTEEEGDFIRTIYSPLE